MEGMLLKKPYNKSFYLLLTSTAWSLLENIRPRSYVRVCQDLGQIFSRIMTALSVNKKLVHIQN